MNISSSVILLFAALAALVSVAAGATDRRELPALGAVETNACNEQCTDKEKFFKTKNCCPGRRRVTAAFEVLGRDEWQAYKESCSSLEFELSLFVDSHLFVLATPVGDTINQECIPLFFHANVFKGRKEVAKFSQESSDAYKKESIVLRTSPFSDIATAYDQVEDAVVAGEGDIVRNNCGDFIVNFCANLGVKATPRVTKLVAKRLAKAGFAADEIRNSGSFATLVADSGDAMTDEELIEQLVESRTRALYEP